jgi:hypothetical protein
MFLDLSKYAHILIPIIAVAHDRRGIRFLEVLGSFLVPLGICIRQMTLDTVI